MKVVGENALKKLITLIKTKFESLAKVATSGSYNDLSDKPTIPSVGNGRITIKQGGTIKGAFTVNQSGATAIELDDNDTHYTSKNVVGSSTDDTNNTTTALTNGKVYLNSVENGSVTSSHKISGIGGTTVSTDTSGNIIIKGTTGTSYSTGTEDTAGITKLYSGLGTNTDGTMTQLAIGDALAGKAGTLHTHTKSDITDFPTSLKNPNGLRVQVNGDGASEVRYDGSAAKTINIKAGSNVTITSDSSGNITISSTASAGSVTGDVGKVVYEATAYNTSLQCDSSTTNNTTNSVTIEDSNWSYKRFRFYCKGYFGLQCVDMPLDSWNAAYITGDERGKRYGGVILPSAENGNINSTGLGPSSHMYYEIKWRVEKVAVGWTVRVVDSGWLGFNAGITSNDDYTGNSSAAVAGTNYISWNQRHNYAYGIYKIVAYTV